MSCSRHFICHKQFCFPVFFFYFKCYVPSTCIGVCKASPSDLDFDEFDELSDYEDSTWVLTGSELFCAGSPIEVNYPLDLDSVGLGACVGVMVRSNGALHFYLNGEDMGCAARDVPDG